MHGCRVVYGKGGRDMGSLVVTRKDGEAIHIGDDVKIEVLEINGRRAKIRVVAPKDVQILRGELLQRSDHAEQDVTIRTMRVGQGRGPRRAA